MYAVVYPACSLPLALVLGLHIQHGSKRGCRNCGKPTLEWFQLRPVPEDRTYMGSLAWSLRCLDHHGYELGAA